MTAFHPVEGAGREKLQFFPNMMPRRCAFTCRPLFLSGRSMADALASVRGFPDVRTVPGLFPMKIHLAGCTKKAPHSGSHTGAGGALLSQGQ